ncbi:MAG: hypothetical protein AB1400_08610 [Pseudomonadota bacterium]
MKGALLIDELKRRFNLKTDRELASHMGMSEATLHGWKRQKAALTEKQIANVIEKSCKLAITKSQVATIRPIVEFFPINATKVGAAGKYEVIPTGNNAGRHRSGLCDELKGAKQGLYVFYDSRGKALYAGQTKRQNIWKEMNLAFNRDRNAQVITLVRHPTKDVDFRPANEKVRQPTSVNLKLHDLATYFSAFEVTDGMVDELEALLVRVFPNDLLNFKMEKFGKAAKRRPVGGKAPVNKKPTNRIVKK